MKKYIIEDEKEGLMKLLGDRVTIFCMNYIYTGKLIGVNDVCILLEKAQVVYETGRFNDKDWSDAQDLPHNWYVQIGSIESFGILK